MKSREKGYLKSKYFKAGGYSALITLFAAAIVVVINLIVNAIPSVYTKYDTTATGVYTLDEKSAGLAKSLKEDITMYFIVQSGNEDEYVNMLLERYSSLTDKIKVKKIDPALNPAFTSKYSEEKIYENTVIVESEKRHKIVTYEEMYIIEYQPNYTTYQYDAVATDFNGEAVLTSALDFVTTETLPKVYIMSNHSEADFSDTFLKYISNENMEYEALSLLGVGSVPEDCDCLIINSPASDISNDEREMILAYLEKNGKMLVITAYGKDTKNLDSLLENYGALRESGLVLDYGANRYYQYPYWMLPLTGSHEITESLINKYQTFLLEPHGIVKSADIREGVTYSPLLTTSGDSFAKRNIEGSLSKEDGDVSGPFDLAVALSEITENGETKIVWISSDKMMIDAADEMVSGANSALFTNALSWMCEKEGSVSIYAKSLADPTLVISGTSANIWSVILILVLPAAVIAVGISVYVKRRKA